MDYKEKIKSLPIIGQLASSLSALFRRARDFTKKFLFYKKNRNFLKNNVQFRNQYKGRRAFILATGPSIKSQDLSKLKDELCISVSNFFVHPDFKKIKPEYHIFAASHDPITDEQYTAVFRDAEKYFPDGQKVLVSITDKYLIDQSGVFKNQKVYYYSVGGTRPNKISNIDFTKRLPIIQTVTHIAIYLSFYLGCRDVYLLGCEHDTILHFGESRHFYDEKKNVMVNLGYNGWDSFEITLKAYLNLWQTYREIREHAAKRDIKIYNCTPKSLLDIFPMEILENVIK